METLIRNELPSDYRRVEEITREAFWDIHVPGCDEHYIVHAMRGHEDFIPELDFVILEGHEVIGNIMYTKSTLRSGTGKELGILSFGPLSVLPRCQRKGYGRRLIEFSMSKARELGYRAIAIYGSPWDYVKHGFRSCKRYGVMAEGGLYPAALLVKELTEGALGGNTWTLAESPVFAMGMEGFEEYDKGFPPREKRVIPRQEEFFILSRARIME